eukprot:GEMP01026276.1.p1 GENE.GEMP01026276.1~~GEMP01026276.1.p1  ORF type:complete len:356 (+),score=71.58 GEMP01026276.1:228-1295(+)
MGCKQTKLTESTIAVAEENKENTPDVDPSGEESAEASQEDTQKMDDYTTMRKRRSGVSAAACSTEKMKDFVKPVYAKSPEDTQNIISFIKNKDKLNLQVLFGHLSDAAIGDVVAAMYDQNVEKGENIIQQGDPGEAFYIVESGTYDIFVARKGSNDTLGTPKKVLEVGAGSSFGELALMYNAPRAATIRCTSETSRVWVLDRQPFQMLLITAESSKKSLYQGWLSDVALFKDLNHYEMSQLSDMLQSDAFSPGEVILKQGEIGDKFYILEDGECAAYIAGNEGDVEVKKYSSQGDYFGEIALLSDEPRKATVKAVGEGASLLFCDKEDFIRVIGPIKELLMKDINKYPQYQAFLE